jgi:hypothetical protein
LAMREISVPEGNIIDGRDCTTPSVECVGCSTPGHWCAARGRAITFADLLWMWEFDAEDRPPAGTECAQCRSFGHYCPAKGMCGSYALCLACGKGHACEQLAAVERMRMGAAEMFAVEDGWHSQGRTVELSEVDRVAEETAAAPEGWAAFKATLDPENLKRGLTSTARVPLAARPNCKVERKARSLERRMRKASKVKGNQVVKDEETNVAKIQSEETKAEVMRLAGVGESINAIARQVGTDWASVKNLLVAEGLIIPKAKVTTGPSTKPPKKKISALAVTALPVIEQTVEVKIRVTGRHLDSFLAGCTLEEKALAFSAVLEAR